MYPGIIPREVEVEKGSILHSLEQSLEVFGEPVYGASNQFWILEMHKRIIRDDCNMLLTGQGGNFSISWPPPELSDTKKGIKETAIRLLRTGASPDLQLPYVSNEFLSIITKNQFSIPYKKRSVHPLQPFFLRNSISYAGSLQKQVSLYRGFHVTDPTVDKEVVEFCLSLPYRAYHERAESRKLVNHGMRGFIPDDILSNQTRSVQSSDIQYRVEEERESLLEKLLFFNKNKLVKFVFETEKLIKDWTSFDFTQMKRKEINHLLRIILISMFLSKLEE